MSLFSFRAIFEAVARFLALAIMIMQIVERPQEGEKKIEEHAEAWRQAAQKLIEDGTLPRWLEPLAVSSSFMRWLIEVLVYYANRFGFFQKTSAAG